MKHREKKTKIIVEIPKQSTNYLYKIRLLKYICFMLRAVLSHIQTMEMHAPHQFQIAVSHCTLINKHTYRTYFYALLINVQKSNTNKQYNEFRDHPFSFDI